MCSGSTQGHILHLGRCCSLEGPFGSEGGGWQTYRTLKFFVRFFELNSVLLMEASIINPCMIPGSELGTNYRDTTIMRSLGVPLIKELQGELLSSYLCDW